MHISNGTVTNRGSEKSNCCHISMERSRITQIYMDGGYVMSATAIRCPACTLVIVLCPIGRHNVKNVKADDTLRLIMEAASDIFGYSNVKEQRHIVFHPQWCQSRDNFL